MDKMTVHRGLRELKLLNDRISSATVRTPFIVANKVSNKVIAGKLVENFQKDIHENYQSVNDLIKRRNAIKQAIVLSNAVTKVSVNGVEMTVAEAIETKQSIGYKRTLHAEMLRQWKTELAKVQKENEAMQDKLEKFLTSTLGSKEATSKDQIESLSKMFKEQNEFVLVNPLDLKEKIDALADEVNGFMAEVDAVLSESNAITLIEV